MFDFILIPSDLSASTRPGEIPDGFISGHFIQKKDYTCGAASLSMLTGLTEEECGKLAKTTRKGTYMGNAAEALRELGFKAHDVFVDRPIAEIRVELDNQSHRWPLCLSLAITDRGTYPSGRKGRRVRHHAVVMAQGRVFDPGTWQEDTVDTLGEVRVKSYIILEK